MNQRGSHASGSEQPTFSRFFYVAFRPPKTPIRSRALTANGATMPAREDPMTNPQKKDTALPLLPGGNSGNTAAAPPTHAVEDIARLFRDVIEPLPDPPFEVLDDGAVLDWVDRATARLVFRRDRQRLLRQAMR